MEPSVEPPEAPPASPRPVVAVVVTHDAPAARFEQVLRALAVQDYPNLDVLVVDTGDEDATERVHDVLPAARVHRVAGDPGYGEAANVVLDLVSGADFYVFAHDDAAPDPDAVRRLVEAADEWDADVVGPKLVQWDDPRRFARFGMVVDKLGVTLPLVERGERDQGQHDGLRDVFAVPGAFTLVRASRFAEVGGFDEAISFQGDDLSLAWRIRIAGGKVLVTSDARVRHAEAFADRPGGDAAVARLAARHRVRVLLSSYRLPTLLAVVPQALALAIVDVVGAIVTGRLARAGAAIVAWPWNLWHLPSLVAARREVRRFRAVGDAEIRRHQVHGVVGPRLKLRRAGAGSRARAATRRATAVPVRGKMEVDPAAWSPGTSVVALAVAAVLALGSRHLVTQGVPAIGELVPAGDGAGDLLRAWASGWRPVGLGADAATPGVTGVLGALAGGLFGHTGLARTLLTLGLFPLGIVGAHRLLAPVGSKRAQVAAAVAYAAVPLPYDALATGRWSALAAYAGAPWLLARLARASGVAPFGPTTDPLDAPITPAGVADDPVVPHSLWKHVIATGAVTAAMGLLVPQAPLLLVATGIALVLGALLAGEMRGSWRVLVTAAGGAAVSAVLLLPTTLDVLGAPGGVDAWLGASSDPAGLSATDLLSFRTGPATLAALSAALLAAAAMPLLVGRRWRLGWATRGWAVAVVAWGLVWAGEQGWLTVRRPDPGVVLALGAAGLALAVGLGLSAIEHDVRGRSWRFGARRLVAVVGLVALVPAVVVTLVASADGRWNMPRDGFTALLGFADTDVSTHPGRVLWVGDDELVPGGGGWPLGDDLTYTAATTRAVPGVADLWPTTTDGASERLGEALEVALAHDTTRLGRALAPMAVRYVVVPRRLGPDDTEPRDAPAQRAADAAADELASALAEQLDLEQVRVDDSVLVYRNTAALQLRTTVPAGAEMGDPAAPEPALDEDASARSGAGPVDEGATIVQASTASEHWRLQVTDADGTVTADHRTFGGWADAFAVEGGGDARLDHETPTAARAVLIGQVVAWLLALAVALRMRFGAGDAPRPDPVSAVPDEDEDVDEDDGAAGEPDASPERVLIGQASGP